MTKSRDAFRTISEVADWLDTPAHVLRFWESKFTQVKPVKRAGGRRYYRPQDMELLGGIKALLHDDGMTIKGVQKLLREKGIKHVAAMGRSLDREEIPDAKGALEAGPANAPDPAPAAPERRPAARATPAPEATPPHVHPASAAAPPGADNVVPLAPGPDVEEAGHDRPGQAPAPDSPDRDTPETGTPAAALLAAIPDDPADSDSRARPRVMNVLRRIPDPERQLQARAGEIAPLLDRMQALRDRISQR